MSIINWRQSNYPHKLMQNNAIATIQICTSFVSLRMCFESNQWQSPVLQNHASIFHRTCSISKSIPFSKCNAHLHKLQHCSMNKRDIKKMTLYRKMGRETNKKEHIDFYVCLISNGSIHTIHIIYPMWKSSKKRAQIFVWWITPSYLKALLLYHSQTTPV